MGVRSLAHVAIVLRLGEDLVIIRYVTCCMRKCAARGD
jgi:hypothetical protein